MSKRIRVGIIGANPDRSWAAQAHRGSGEVLDRQLGSIAVTVGSI